MLEQKSINPGALEAFREATMELDNVYSLFPKECGLSYAEYWSLLLIYEGAATQSQISDQLFISRQTLNSAFKLLRKKELIKLEPYEENQRSKQAFLTEKGRYFVENHVMKVHRIEEIAWKKMTESDRNNIIALTRKYTKFIRELLQNSSDKQQLNRQSSED